MQQTARPPSQYVVAPGTKYRLISNEYDKNTYAQCSYASNRTLIRCKQIRSKEELAKNSGRCEEHLEFSKLLETNHKREVMRCHAENDTKMQRRRFDPWIASNEYISDEDDYLQPMQNAPQGIAETSNDNFIDHHPLRYATHYTDKDVLKIRMGIVQRDIEDLKEFKRLLTAQAQKEHEVMGDDEEEDCPTDPLQKRLFKACKKYAREDYLTLTTTDPVYKLCSIGPAMDDKTTVAYVIHSLLNKIDNKTPIDVENKCEKPALPLSSFCIDHITMDRRQKLFDSCVTCGATAIGGVEPKCSVHLKARAIADMSDCLCAKCVPPVETKDEKKRPASRAAELDLSDDEETLGNLSKFESMVSPMSQFGNPLSFSPSPSSSSAQKAQRRYQGAPAQILRPPQLGPPPGMLSTVPPSTTSTSQVPYHPNKNIHHPRSVGGGGGPTTLPSFTPQQIQEQQRLRLEEEEANSQTCSRVRPIEPTQYGAGKKKLQQQLRQQQRPTVYPTKKISTLTSPPGPPGSGIKTFQGWRNQGTSSSQRSLQPPGMLGGRYALHQNRAQLGPQPRTIPLERIQEPRNADELVEDRGDSPPTGRLPEPQRRGVPYYRNGAYRRTELPTRHAHHSPLTPSTSTSSSQLLAPPQSPQGSPYRPPTRLPMAPHRAIAAGLNPADVGQRPAYRIPMPMQRTAQGPSPPGGGGIRRPQHAPNVVHRMMTGTMPRPTGGLVTTSYVVQGAPRAEIARKARTSQEAKDSEPKREGGAPVETVEDPNAVIAAAGLSAIKSLDSARHDARFANINVKTFLSMGNRDFEKMTQEEIDKMAAAASETHEKGQRKTAISSVVASGMPPVGGASHISPHIPRVQPQTQRSQTPRGSTSSSNSLKDESAIPDAVKQVVSTPSIVSRGPPPPSATMETTPEDVETQQRKRKLETTPEPVTSSEKPSEEPTAKKAKEEKNDSPKTPKTPTPLKTTPPSTRTPRAAAIAANQALTHHNRIPAVTPTTSTASSTMSEEQNNPLDLLAELSAAAEEMEAIGGPSMESTPSTSTGNNKKTPKKTSPPAKSTSTVFQRRSSTGKKPRGASREKEEEPPKL